MKEKKYKCKVCGKEYVFYGWVIFHSKKTGHKKFKRINEIPFLQ